MRLSEVRPWVQVWVRRAARVLLARAAEPLVVQPEARAVADAVVQPRAALRDAAVEPARLRVVADAAAAGPAEPAARVLVRACSPTEPVVAPAPSAIDLPNCRLFMVMPDVLLLG